eukprot:764272-Hanusia_phi.AAC.5
MALQARGRSFFYLLFVGAGSKEESNQRLSHPPGGSCCPPIRSRCLRPDDDYGDSICFLESCDMSVPSSPGSLSGDHLSTSFGSEVEQNLTPEGLDIAPYLDIDSENGSTLPIDGSISDVPEPLNSPADDKSSPNAYQCPPMSSSNVGGFDQLSREPGHLFAPAKFHDTNVTEMNWAQNISMDDTYSNFSKLPLARIKKIMKCCPQVQMVAGESPVVLAHTCELFIKDITSAAWSHCASQGRRMILESDLRAGVGSESARQCHDRIFSKVQTRYSRGH